MEIGFIGLGAMGRGMAKNLARPGTASKPGTARAVSSTA